VSAAQETGLYRRFDLAAAPAKPFLMCGCEASADAAQKLVGHLYVAVTWPQAPGAWQWVDLTLLKARKGLLIPDATPDSRQDMQGMAERLAGLGLELRITSTEDRPPDWCLCDWEGGTEEFIAWAKARTVDYKPPPAAPEPPPEELPPLEAYADGAPAKPKRKRPQLAAVNGNTVRAPEVADEALPQPLSHDALAEHFVEKHGEDWRYVAPWGKWYRWDADCWREDAEDRNVGLAKHVTRDALTWTEAQQLTPAGKRDINSIGTAKALLSFARISLSALPEQWDTDPWLLGVPGGVIDLRDGRMLEAVREQYISKRCAVAPQSGRPQMWHEYLTRVHAGNDESISYLQRYAGYCATGETKEHALAFLFGTGRNGKGIFLETISRILGDYARTASMDTFLEQKHAAHSTELARLHGARLVVTEEAASGGRWNESRIKHLTGGGKITAHYMRQDDFEFVPKFKLLIAANHKPLLRSVDEAIKSRIHLVPFNVTIPPEERDKDLLQKLEAEWPQILGWILDGCAEWRASGLQVPDSIRRATEQYVESEDVMGAWLEENCVQEGEHDGAILYENYARWCDAQHERAQSRRAWSNVMLERGCGIRKSAGRRIFIGLSLKAATGDYVPPYRD